MYLLGVLCYIIVSSLSLSGHRVRELTVCTPPPERCPATAFEIEGFSATHKTLMVLI